MKPPDTLSAVPDDPFADPLSWLVEDESIPRVGLPANTSAEAWDMADQHLSVDPAVQTSFAFCVIDFERDVMVNLSLVKENWIGRVDQESLTAYSATTQARVCTRTSVRQKACGTKE